jgi:4-hydroxy-4-methyl-2-oxoglutarate aldolase
MNRYEIWKRDYEEYEAKGKIWGTARPERISQFKFPRIDRAVIDQFLQIEDLTSTISDIMDSMGIAGAVSASQIKPLFPSRKIAGTAVTLRHIPERITCTQGYVINRVKDIRLATMDMYHLAEPGDILVVDGGGSPDISHIGGMSCIVANASKMGGTIVDGGIRDIETIRKLDYPIWSRGITPITSKYRIEAIELNGPVKIHNVQVIPGDLVIADETGVVFIPPDKIESILAELIRLTKLEDELTELVNKAGNPEEIRAAHRRRVK